MSGNGNGNGIGMTAEPRAASRQHASGGTHIGVAAIFALVVIVCMAVLAVLAVSTAHSSLVLAQRQADAVQEVYRAETAAQTFVSEMDASLREGGPRAVEANLAAICAATKAAAPDIALFAGFDDAGGSPTVSAQFETPGGRVLKVTLALSGGSYEIRAWRMTAVVHEEEPMGTLYVGD